VDTWGKWYCPKCGAHNKVCFGDLNDQTAPDVEAVKCHNCGHIDWFDEFTKEECAVIGTTLEDAYYEDGEPPCSYCGGTGVRRETGK
jgi:hypothetical protein